MKQHQLLVFGGVYGNAHALRALREIADARGFTPQEVLCTGDLAAYCAEPQECIDLVRAWGIRSIAGNVEQQLSLDCDSCGCNFIPGSTCDTLSKSWWEFCRERINDDSKRWMATLPSFLKLECAGISIGVTHGSPQHSSEFIFTSTPWSDKQSKMEDVGVSLMIAGHCGLPFASMSAGCLWLNSGALGMPANDGTRRVWYAVVEFRQEGKVIAELIPLEYDWESAERAMRAAYLPSGYADALRSGLWPSQDILPDLERRKQGEEIVQQRYEVEVRSGENTPL
jgi:hypothetical protein